jgi:hypothetical protein
VKDSSIWALCRTYGLPDARFVKSPKTRQLAGKVAQGNWWKCYHEKVPPPFNFAESKKGIV